MRIGQSLRLARERLGLSHSALAVAAGVAPETVRRAEAGTGRLGATVAARLLLALRRAGASRRSLRAA